MEQRSEQWYQARLGKFTASRIYDITSRTKRGEATAAWEDYIMDLVAEVETGVPTEMPTTRAMQWGIDHEDEAIIVYEETVGCFVERVGFIDHPTLMDCGGSPDGLVRLDGGIEVKCPSTKQHLRTLLTGEIKPEYIAQIQWNLACTRRDWFDFISFDPRCSVKNMIKIIPVQADLKIISLMEEAVLEAQKELYRRLAILSDR
jgi:YqaJ-like viral recombinase domain